MPGKAFDERPDGRGGEIFHRSQYRFRVQVREDKCRIDQPEGYVKEEGEDSVIFIALMLAAAVTAIMYRAGLVKNPIAVFLTACLVIGALAILFGANLNCPFAKRCPFHFCPLNR